MTTNDLLFIDNTNSSTSIEFIQNMTHIIVINHAEGSLILALELMSQY